MAKKSSADEQPKKSIAITIKGSEEWRDWVNRGAKHCRRSVAVAIDDALVLYFKKSGFNEPPPER